MRLLERMGHRVDIAPDGQEAVAAVTSYAYDLVLMDCQMPRMDGYAATRAIRQLDPSRLIPIVAMTASATPEAQRRCREAGMDDFLTKPVVAVRLYDLIEKIACGASRGPSPRSVSRVRWRYRARPAARAGAGHGNCVPTRCLTMATSAAFTNPSPFMSAN